MSFNNQSSAAPEAALRETKGHLPYRTKSSLQGSTTAAAVCPCYTMLQLHIHLHFLQDMSNISQINKVSRDISESGKYLF